VLLVFKDASERYCCRLSEKESLQTDNEAAADWTVTIVPDKTLESFMPLLAVPSRLSIFRYGSLF
jgi:hypothetical protein